MKRKFIQKIIALAGSVMMLAASLPAPVIAAEDGTSEENTITVFEESVYEEETDGEEDTEEPRKKNREKKSSDIDLDLPIEKEEPEYEVASEPEEDVSETEAEEAASCEEPTGVFTGITIDGDFSDWDAVAKTPAGAGDFYSGVTAVAVVQLNDMVYVYIRDTGCGTASWSGPNMNGTFEFISDLGYRKVLQLNSENNGKIYSVTY